MGAQEEGEAAQGLALGSKEKREGCFGELFKWRWGCFTT